MGATIFTAALADCGLVKKAMAGREVKRRKKRAGRPMEVGEREVNRHPQRHARSSLLTQVHHVLSCEGCRSIKNITPKCKYYPLAL